jgi:hypothetical protein
VRPLQPNAYPQRKVLLVFEHETMSIREIPVDVPERLEEGEAARTFVVDALANRRVLAETKAPDGYVMQVRDGSRPGLAGELFGMSRYNRDVVLEKDGRVVTIELSQSIRYASPVTALGWIADQGTR